MTTLSFFEVGLQNIRRGQSIFAREDTNLDFG
jgi:hypothetical protein